MAINYSKQNKKLENLLKENSELKIKLDNEIQKTRNFSNLKHETARLNTLILTLAESLNTQFETEPNAKEFKKFFKNSKNKINTIYHTSSMISSRMIYADLELNPEALERQMKFEANIYKKFDKARYILAEDAHKFRKRIHFLGTSFFAISAITAFDCVPFILLDNAVKYAPADTSIEVIFQEDIDEDIALKVTVKSLGPLIQKESLKKLIVRGFRDKSAKLIPGEGLGLYIANELCNLHDVILSFSSSPPDNLSLSNQNGEYGIFEASLIFRSCPR